MCKNFVDVDLGKKRQKAVFNTDEFKLTSGKLTNLIWQILLNIIEYVLTTKS